jgi:hypothetical protein
LRRSHPLLTLGFHGCDRTVGEEVRDRGAELVPSSNRHDWLGPGVYFWESDPVRAAEWAHEQKSRNKLNEAFVVGAVIDLGNCLDLTKRENLDVLKEMHKVLRATHKASGTQMPKNKDAPGRGRNNKLLRFLDCEVIRSLHAFQTGLASSSAESFDTVRSPFMEGGPAYPGSAFKDHTHTQIAVINPECILGVFRPRDIAAIIAKTARKVT